MTIIMNRGVSVFAVLAVTKTFSVVTSHSLSDFKPFKQNHLSGSVCHRNQGQCNNCPCDINVALCDNNCCCDEDCTYEEVSSFAVSCNDNSGINRNTVTFARFLSEKGLKVTKCSESEKQLSNKKLIDKPQQFSLKRLIDFIEEEIQGLLCVKYDNSAVSRVYFKEIEVTEIDLIEKYTMKDDKVNLNRKIPFQANNAHQNEGMTRSNTSNYDYSFHYQFPYTVLTGTRQKENIKTSDTGFMIMGPGHCFHQGESTTVRFGENISVICTVSLNSTELQDLCESSNHPYLNRVSENIVVPKWLQHNYDVVGTIKSSNPHTLEEWIEITSDHDHPDFIGKSRVWNPLMKECRGLISRSTYRFFWTYFGSIHNPQAKIVRVTVEHDDNNILIHRSNDKKKQYFRFTTSVSWIYVEPSTDIKFMSRPRLLFTVPNDVFYPFHKETSSQGNVLDNSKVIICCLCGFILSVVIM